MAGVRVTDEMVRRWLRWARNYGEIESFERVKGGWLVRCRQGIPRTGVEPLFGLREEDLVPSELLLRPKEALAFAYGLALGGNSRDRREWTQEDWAARSQGSPPPESD